MRTYIGAPVALHALGRIPLRNIDSDASLLECSGSGWNSAVSEILEDGNRNIISVHTVCRLQYVVDVIGVLLVSAFCQYLRDVAFCVSPLCRNFYFVNAVYTGVNSSTVHIYDVLAFASVRLLDRVLHVSYCIIDRQDVRQFEECSLQNSIGSAAKAQILRDRYSVAGVEVDIILSDESLDVSRQLLGKFFIGPRTVEQECSALLDVLDHVVSFQIRSLVAGNEVSLLDIIC